MKKYIIILIIAVTCNSCLAQKTTKMKNIVIPEIIKDFEIFDKQTFNKEIDSMSGKRIVNNDNFYLEEETQSFGYIRRKYPNESFFMVSKKFYQNGNIKEKSISFNNGYPIEKIYKFNPEGKFIDEINTDEGYIYSWQDILKYCAKNNIELTKGYISRGGVPTEIYKTELDGKKFWQLTYFDKKVEKIFQVILDGQNGELLNKKEVELIGG